MSTDIASLSFAIDSSQAVTSLDALTKLQERASSLADQQRRLGQESQTADTALGRLRGSATAFTASLADMTAGLQQANPQVQRSENLFNDLNARLAAAQKLLSDMPEGVDRYLQVHRQVESVARALGQSADGLVGFINRTNDMRLASEATAASLDRITRALENQTAAGTAVRAVLKEYGVEIEKYGLNQPEKVLGEFRDRLGAYRDTPAKVRDVQMVMGSLSPDDLNTILFKGYTPIEERRQKQMAADASADITRTMSDVEFRRRQREADEAELSDLRSRYRDPGRGTQSEDLAELRRINALPPSERREFMDWDAKLAFDGQNSDLGRWLQFMGSGRYSANAALIQEQVRRTEFENSGPVLLPEGLGGGTLGAIRGRLISTGQYLRDNTLNLFGAWEAPPSADQRPEDPYGQVRRDLTLATQLASYGEVGFMGVAAGRQRLLRMEKEGGRDAFRRAFGGEGPTQGQMDELAAARADYAAQTAAWGAYDAARPTPPPLMLARDRLQAAERTTAPLLLRQRDADQRFENIRTLNEDLIRYGERPEERVFDATARGRFMAGQMPQERAFSTFVLQQAQQLNVPTSRIENYQDGADFLARGGFNDRQRLAVTQAWDQQQDANLQARSQGLQDQIDLQTKLRDAMDQGAGAVERVRVAEAARLQTLNQGGGPVRAAAAAEIARQELLQKNLTLTKQAVEQIDEETGALKRRNDALEAAPQTGLGRQVATINADIAEQTRAAERARPGTNAGEQDSAARRARLAQQALGDAGELLAKSQEQLRLEQQVAVAMTGRAETVAKLRRDVEIEAQFQKDIAAAIASGNEAAVQRVLRAREMTKELQDQLTALRSLADLTQQLVALGDRGREAAQRSDYLLGVPRDQRGREGVALDVSAIEGRRLAEAGQRVRTDADQRFGTLPERVREAVDAEAASLPAEARQAFRRTIGLESPRGDAAYSNPAQMTPPAVRAVLEARARASGSAMPTDQDVATQRAALNNPANYLDSVRMGREYYQLMLDQFGGNVPAATAAYRTGPSVVRDYVAGNPRPLAAAYDGDGVRRFQAGGGEFTAVEMRLTYGATPVGQRAINEQQAAYDAQQRYGSVVAWEDWRDRTSGRGQYLQLLRQGETGRAQLVQADAAILAARNSGDRPRLAQAEQAREDLRFGNVAEFESRVGQAEREVTFQGQLAEAYGQSAARVQEVTVAYRAMQEAKRLGLDATSAEILKEKELAAARAQTLAQASAEAKRSRDQGDLYKADAEVPWWASPETRGRARARAQSDLYIRNNNLEGTKEAEDIRKWQDYEQTQRAIAEDQDRLRQGFLAMGESAKSAFAEAVLGGKSLQQVLAGLLRDWASIMLNVASRKAFTMLGEGIMGLFGGSSFMPSSPGQVPGASIPMLQASGGAFQAGEQIKLFAAGDVVDRPTMFGLAGGKRALLAEAGRAEGVFPLARTARGELGVQVAPDPSRPGARLEPLALTRMPNGDLAVRLPDPLARDRQRDAAQFLARLDRGEAGIPVRASAPHLFAAGGVVSGGEVRQVSAASDSPRAPAPLPVPVSPLMTAAPGALSTPRAAGSQQVSITNNIKIDGGSVGKGGIDEEARRALERQIEQTTRQAVLRVIADEKRQGGMLYGNGM